MLTQKLKTEFATSRGKELYSIKLACHWSHRTAPYSDLLGSLTTLGDVEALSYQWQGHADKVHNADRMLKRVCFLHLCFFGFLPGSLEANNKCCYNNILSTSLIPAK